MSVDALEAVSNGYGISSRSWSHTLFPLPKKFMRMRMGVFRYASKGRRFQRSLLARQFLLGCTLYKHLCSELHIAYNANVIVIIMGLFSFYSLKRRDINEPSQCSCRSCVVLNLQSIRSERCESTSRASNRGLSTESCQAYINMGYSEVSIE